MDPYRTEEDQIRALRQWWDENGSSTLIGVGLALAIVFGWQWWQQHLQQAADEGAVLYQQLLQATDKAVGDEVQLTTALHLATELRDGQGASRYGDYAALVLARLLVEKQDLAAAEAELRALTERHPASPPSGLERRVRALLGHDVDTQLGALARVRLARVLHAEDRHAEALAVLDEAGSGDFEAEKQELRGDILRAQGDAQAAIAAYRAALDPAGGGSTSRLVELKLKELELSQAEEPAVAPPGVATAPAGAEGVKP